MKRLDLNVFQALSFTGIFVCAAAHIAQHLMGRDMKHFWLLYPIWVVVFIIATIVRIYGKDNMGHHHHHDHDHDHHENETNTHHNPTESGL